MGQWVEHTESLIRLAMVAVLLTTMTVIGSAVHAVEGESERAWSGQDRFNAHLNAGEYHLARQMADQSDGRQRDAWLSQMAEHQANHGAFAQSIETASYIQSDLSRSDTLTNMRNSPFSDFGGAAGGGVVADFDSLIDLIENTIAVDSWSDVGGPGSIEEFAAGVHVDATGTLRRIDRDYDGSSLRNIRDESSLRSLNQDVTVPSRLRKVSLTRLEKEVQLRHAMGLPATDIMKNLAGLQRIEYVFVYPETGDIVIAGPAEGWTYDGDGRAIAETNQAPVLQLDDLVVCLRNAYDHEGVFGCSIDPRPENLEATQRFLSSTTLTGRRFREELQSTLGLQNITIHGIDPSSHAAHVLVEADYRMKLVGIGLEDGVLGVDSYLDMIELDEDGNPPSMDVVRWWFAMNYDALTTTEDRNGFQLNGPAVQVLSESEFLNRDGERIRSGGSTLPTARFAEGFSKNFDSMSAKYPIYADLRNVFDMALVASIIREEALDDQVDWNLTYFGSPSRGNSNVYQTAVAATPRQVETVMNHRTINGRRSDGQRVRHLITSVSGGVVADTRPLIDTDSIKQDQYGLMQPEFVVARPQELDHHQWWWD